MPQNSQKIKRLSNCPSLSTAVPECAVVIAAQVEEASLKRRKEEAGKTLYIARI